MRRRKDRRSGLRQLGRRLRPRPRLVIRNVRQTLDDQAICEDVLSVEVHVQFLIALFDILRFLRRLLLLLLRQLFQMIIVALLVCAQRLFALRVHKVANQLRVGCLMGRFIVLELEFILVVDADLRRQPLRVSIDIKQIGIFAIRILLLVSEARV